MTDRHYRAAFAKLDAARDACAAPCLAVGVARNALKRSKSRKNYDAFKAAEAEWDAKLAIVDALYAEVEAAEALDAAEAAEAAAAADAYASPMFL